MSVIFEALQKLRHENGDSPETDMDETLEANVYTLKDLLFSPQGIISITIALFLVCGAAYYGIDYFRSVSGNKTGPALPQDMAASYIPPSDNNASPDQHNESDFKAPPPPRGIAYEKPESGRLYLPPRNMARQPDTVRSEPRPVYLSPSGTEQKVWDHPTVGKPVSTDIAPKIHRMSVNKEILAKETGTNIGNGRHDQVFVNDAGHAIKAVATDSKKVDMAYGKSKSGPPGPALKTGHVQQEMARKDRMRTAKISGLIMRLQGAISEGNDVKVLKLLPELETIKGADDPFVLKLKAFWRMKQGKYDRAADLLGRVLEENPYDLTAGLDMAIVEIKTDRLAKARNRLKVLRSRYPDNEQIPDLLRKIEGR